MTVKPPNDEDVVAGLVKSGFASLGIIRLLIGHPLGHINNYESPSNRAPNSNPRACFLFVEPNAMYSASLHPGILN
jgi:hypothetical protein